MTSRLFLAVGAALTLAALAGCASSPPSRFYTLSSTAPPAAASTAAVSIVVGPVAIPAVVDRPQIVVTVGENEIRLDEFNRWASPLAEALALAVAENLGSLLQTPRVMLLTQTAGAIPDYRVAIEVQRFETAPGAYALLDAVYSVRRTTDQRAMTGRTTARETVTEGSYDALAAAHSRAVARLSGDIAGTVRTLQGLAVEAAPAAAR
jgi:uncharacterized lipoprotein YmbA